MKSPHDITKKRFGWLEAQIEDINSNVSLLMEALTNKLGIFKEDGGYNVIVGSEGKLAYQEEP